MYLESFFVYFWCEVFCVVCLGNVVGDVDINYFKVIVVSLVNVFGYIIRLYKVSYFFRLL